MKKLMIFAVLLLSMVWAKAQEDMTTVWETKLGHQILHAGTSLKVNTAMPHLTKKCRYSTTRPEK